MVVSAITCVARSDELKMQCSVAFHWASACHNMSLAMYCFLRSGLRAPRASAAMSDFPPHISNPMLRKRVPACQSCNDCGCMVQMREAVNCASPPGGLGSGHPLISRPSAAAALVWSQNAQSSSNALPACRYLHSSKVHSKSVGMLHNFTRSCSHCLAKATTAESVRR